MFGRRMRRGPMGPFRELMMKMRFIFSEPRWTILKILENNELGTNAIHRSLHERGFPLPRSTLYYHLSALQDAGFIELAGYREEGGGAPEKIWRLKIKKIVIDILKGEIYFDSTG